MVLLYGYLAECHRVYTLYPARWTPIRCERERERERETAAEAAYLRPAIELGRNLSSTECVYDVIRNKTLGVHGNQIFNRTT